MSCVAVPILVAFFLWEWYHENPIVDVRLLKNRNFGTAVFFLVRAWDGAVRLHRSDSGIPPNQPRLHGRARRTRSLTGGLILMFMMPVAGALVATKIDPRILVAVGFLGTSITLHMMTVIYLQIDFRSIVILRMIQVMFLPLIFIPISTLNYIGVPREKNNQVSGMSNFARNIGGAIGTSLLSTFLVRQNQTHLKNFANHTTNSDINFQQMIAGLKALFISQGFDTVTATKKALAMAYQSVQAQSSALSFENSFWVMSAIVLCLVPLPFIMRRPPKRVAEQPLFVE